LQDDYYLFDAAGHRLIGRRSGHAYRLGDLVEVEVARVDIDERELDFRLIGRLQRPPREAAGSGAKRKKAARRKAAARPTRAVNKTGTKKAAAKAAANTTARKKTPPR
jgi:ribonuclease R